MKRDKRSPLAKAFENWVNQWIHQPNKPLGEEVKLAFNAGYRVGYAAAKKGKRENV